MLKYFTQARISLRLPLTIVVVLVTIVVLMSYIYYQEFKKETASSAETLAQTTALQAQLNVQNWAEELAQKVDDLASTTTVQETFERFSFVLATSSEDIFETLRTAYIENNPYELGQRHKYDKSNLGSAYDQVHSDIQRYYRNFLIRTEIYDLFLINTDGRIIYTVYKEDDFGTNILDGKYSSSGLGKIFKKAMASEFDQTNFVDFEPYAPSAGQPASFMAKKVVDNDGKVLGVLAIQLPIAKLQGVLEKNAHFVPEDEVYIIGSDGRTRTGSRNSDHLDIFDPAPGLSHVIATASGQDVFTEKTIGIRGSIVTVKAKNFDVFGQNWTSIVELDYNNLHSRLIQFKYDAWIFTITSLFLSIFLGILVSRSITLPIRNFSNAMEQVSNEDYDSAIKGVDRRDEFGGLSKILDSFREKLELARENAIGQIKERDQQAEVVEHLGAALNDFAKGDLTTKIIEPFPEEYEVLRNDFNTTVASMDSLMQNIVSSSGEIRLRTEEISASSDDLSHRTENQAATLEETAAALDELTASVRAAAEGASEVENVVSNARDDANQSGTVVQEAVEAMTLIKSSSNEISQIIGVIDDISFQTNLLSLNAGVEAARAGEAGRGFAVVASEVRALAQRSSEAAKKIKSLINSSSEQVENGVELVGKAGDALNSIIERVSNIDELVVDIASGAREQSVGLGEINVGMNQLDQVTQQNAAMVEQATAAAATLNSETSQLSQIISRFKTSETKHAIQKIAPEIEEIDDVIMETPIEWSATRPENQIQIDVAANSERWQDF